MNQVIKGGKDEILRLQQLYVDSDIYYDPQAFVLSPRVVVEVSKEIVKVWIRLCGERYPKSGLVDVVNEPIQKPASYRNAIGGDGETGWDWVIWSFEKARQAFPNAKLIINEYDILDSAANAHNFVRIIDLLKARSLVDGIGCQGHKLENVNIDTIKANLKLVEATGLPVYISEYDVNEADGSKQLSIYEDQFPVFWNDPQVKGITLWGYIQGQIWRRTHTLFVRTAQRCLRLRGCASMYLHILLEQGNKDGSIKRNCYEEDSNRS